VRGRDVCGWEGCWLRRSAVLLTVGVQTLRMVGIDYGRAHYIFPGGSDECARLVHRYIYRRGGGLARGDSATTAPVAGTAAEGRGGAGGSGVAAEGREGGGGGPVGGGSDIVSTEQRLAFLAAHLSLSPEAAVLCAAECDQVSPSRNRIIARVKLECVKQYIARKLPNMPAEKVTAAALAYVNYLFSFR
jgi:hypothetical protein